MANPDSSTDDIRLRMQALRAEISIQKEIVRTEICDSKQKFRNAVDIKRQVLRRPWLIAGLAIGIGYFLIPRKKLVPSAVSAAAEHELKRIRDLLARLNPDQAENSSWFKSLFSKGIQFGTQFLIARFQQQAVETFKTYLQRQRNNDSQNDAHRQQENWQSDPEFTSHHPK